MRPRMANKATARWARGLEELSVRPQNFGEALRLAVGRHRKALRSCRKGFDHGNGQRSGQHKQVDELTQVGGRDEMPAAIASRRLGLLVYPRSARASIRKTK